jgi:hypothetical protein
LLDELEEDFWGGEASLREKIVKLCNRDFPEILARFVLSLYNLLNTESP